MFAVKEKQIHHIKKSPNVRAMTVLQNPVCNDISLKYFLHPLTIIYTDIQEKRCLETLSHHICASSHLFKNRVKSAFL